MREAAFDDLDSASLQLLTLLPTCASTALVHRFLPAFGFVVPATPPLVTTRRDVGADVLLAQLRQRLRLVIAFVGYDFDDATLLLR